MHRVTVESTLLTSVAYEPTQGLLEVNLQSGDIYHYFNVPLFIYNHLLAADSKGRYFNTHIRNCFSFKQIYTPQRAATSAV